VKNSENALIFARIMAMRLWFHFFGPPRMFVTLFQIYCGIYLEMIFKIGQHLPKKGKDSFTAHE